MRNCKLEISGGRSGEPALGLRLPDGRRLALNSPYDPRRAAERWASQAAVGPNQVLMVLGLAAGHHLQALAPRLFPSNDVIVLEPVAAILETMNDFPSVRRILHDRRFSLVTDTESLWSQYDRLPNGCWKGLTWLALPAYVQAFPELAAQLQEDIARRQVELKIQRSTVLGTAVRWQQNLFANLTVLQRAAPVSRLFGSLENVPAVIVAAGPSLEQNVDLLKEAQGRALIVATATAARKLAEEALPYDLVVSVDPHEVNFTAHFAGVNHGRRPLCFDPTLCPAVLGGHEGPLGLMRIFPDLAWLERYSLEPFGEVKTAGSVAAVSFDLARRLGCNPIILIGQDLSFTSASTHAGGTFVPGFPMTVPREWLEGDQEKIRRMAAAQPSNPWFHSVRRLQVPSIHGGTVPTDEKLLGTLVWFEREIASCKDRLTVINSSAAGAWIRGARHIPFREALEEYCPQSVGAAVERANQMLGQPGVFDQGRLLEDLVRTRHELSALEVSLNREPAVPDLERAAFHFERSKTVLHFLATPLLVGLFDLKGKQEAGVISAENFRSQAAAAFHGYLKAGLSMLDEVLSALETSAGTRT
jgi:hypothetical protein